MAIKDFVPEVDPDMGLTEEELKEMIENTERGLDLPKQKINPKEELEPVHADHAEALTPRQKTLQLLGTTAVDVTDKELDPLPDPEMIGDGVEVDIEGWIRVHIVKAGETLGGIGKKYDVPYQTLALWNDIPAPKYTIKPGDRILLYEPDKLADKEVVVDTDGLSYNISIDNPIDQSTLANLQSNNEVTTRSSTAAKTEIWWGAKGAETMSNPMDWLLSDSGKRQIGNHKNNTKQNDLKKEYKRKGEGKKKEKEKGETGVLIVPQTPLPVGFEGNKTFGFIYELNKFRISFDERAETVEQSKILTEVETLYNWFKARIASSTDLDDKTAVIMTFEDLLENHKKDLRKLQKEWEKQKTQQKN